MSPTLYQVSEATNILKKVLRGHKETTCNAGDLCSIPGSEDPLEKEWQLTPVFLPGIFHGQRSLVGYSSWGHKQSNMTDRLTL